MPTLVCGHVEWLKASRLQWTCFCSSLRAAAEMAETPVCLSFLCEGSEVTNDHTLDAAPLRFTIFQLSRDEDPNSGGNI